MELDDNPSGSGKHDVNVDAPSNKLEATAANNNNNNNNNDTAAWMKDMKKIILLVSTLIAGMAFQAMINPPGGVFQVSPTDVGVVAAAATASAPAPATAVVGLPRPGSPVMAFYKKNLYNQYSNANTICFVTSLTNIFLITTQASYPFGQHLVFIFLVYFFGCASIGSLLRAYHLVLVYNSRDFLREDRYYYGLVILWCALLLLSVLWNIIKASSSSCCPRGRSQTLTTSAHNNIDNRVIV